MTLLDRYRALPRSGHWLLWGACGLILYFPLVDAPLGLWRDLTDRADARQAQLTAFAKGSSASLGDDLTLGSTRHGDLDPPAPRAQVIDRLERAISTIFEHRSVPKYALTSRTMPLPDPAIAGAEAPALERLIREITFEAPPSRAMEILADLERDPAIVRVPFVQFQGLEDQRVLRARITVEAWAIAETGGRR